jgi:hypothetical protein
MNYSTAQAVDSDTGRKRWAAYCRATRTFYFPATHGKRAADRLAARLNKEVKP